MIDFNKNNLDKASSPYLQQHKHNPIHWQDWSKEVLDYAKKNNKILFVSVGYATCHWCHKMAGEAFENKEIADYLNKHFVAIKVDREQRPDIDHYLMGFITSTLGSGGWPLNVFLTANLRPFSPKTYVPVQPKPGMAGFLDVLKQVKEFYEKNKDKIQEFVLKQPFFEEIEEEKIWPMISESYSPPNAGFGSGPQFPHHNTLLFLMHYYKKNDKIKSMITNILDTMATRGLHDHLQGGFFRYCVDSNWTIPHFEKMIYDQAMVLWMYSLGYKLFKKEGYKIIIEKLISCLEQTYEENGLFYSAHDADTNHEEGKTYLWTKTELQKALTKEEFDKFTKLYEITEGGNFEGKNHLVKEKFEFLPEIENKLLQIRKKRKQPFTDKKIVTSWNALVGIGLLMAGKKDKALTLFNNLLKKHYKNKKLIHSSLGNILQEGEFLEDYGAVLLLATHLYEEKLIKKDIIKELYQKIQTFKKEQWIENKTDDFESIPASTFDHPTPSSVSLAEMAVFRTQKIFGEKITREDYKPPLHFDFYNLMVFLKSRSTPTA